MAHGDLRRGSERRVVSEDRALRLDAPDPGICSS
jgi:hypothetical protein